MPMPALDYCLKASHAFNLLDAAPQVFVIGGAELYAEALPLADELLLTEIEAEVAGDVFFPSWDRAAFEEESRETHVSGLGVDLHLADMRAVGLGDRWRHKIVRRRKTGRHASRQGSHRF